MGAKEAKKGLMEKEGDMTVLAQALGRRHWELAALCLLLGLARALSQLPADSVVGLLDVLDGGESVQTEK